MGKQRITRRQNKEARNGNIQRRYDLGGYAQDRDCYELKQNSRWGSENQLHRKISQYSWQEGSFLNLQGTMFIGVVGRFSDGLENNELWARLWKDTAGREADLVAIAALQHIVGWNAQRQKENLKEIWEGPYL